MASTPLYEIVSEKIIKGLLTLDDIDANQKQQLTQYLSKWNPKTGMIKVNYFKKKHGWGRVYVRDSMGFTSFKKKIRNTMLNDNYLDFDIKNCHPTILLNICQKHNIPCENIRKYVENRTEVIEEVAKKLGTSKENIKDLFLHCSFYRTPKSWAKEYLGKEEVVFPSIVSGYTDDIRNLTPILKKENPKFYECVRKLKEEEGFDYVEKFLGSFLSLYLQETELQIVEKILNWMMANTQLANKDGKYVVTYEYDGLKIWKENVVAFEKEKKTSSAEILTKIIKNQHLVCPILLVRSGCILDMRKRHV